ncbi:hypothetical protein [Fimbriimonas ginsengisoli]|uniref:Uncharacterized protein n=1 Tax=Fimbriimonas ginsengisoli Gsoil 348 TaxID=661478 RepID=A0A068NNR1_FIMGI|nr:hypothetical protein [Fimbriimonas ginsengisoli]AIE85198.1 hypothetical protein OP10G_1830 [Fimbriimonas ginsengisoli Gsoil 348]
MKGKRTLLVVGVLAISAIGATQVKEILKVLGVGAAVKQFGPEINRSINKLTSHKDSFATTTKVVPIISAGIDSRKAIGAAQVMGPRDKVDQVQAVAQLDQDIFGREIKIRAMIPISSKEVVQDIKRVEGVGVSGIVDLKL